MSNRTSEQLVVEYLSAIRAFLLHRNRDQRNARTQVVAGTIFESRSVIVLRA